MKTVLSIIWKEVIEDWPIEQMNSAMDNTFVVKGAMMADAHLGYSLPIWWVVATKDIIVPAWVGYDIWCIDRDTEYLTEKWWKKISNYIKWDKVLQYNKETDEANFITPLKYINLPCDKFYHFKNGSGLDQMLSEEHKVLLWKWDKKRKYILEDVLVKDLSKYWKRLNSWYYGVKASFNIDSKWINFTDKEIKLNILIAADGCIEYQNETENRIYMHLKKERKILRLKSILHDSNIKYKETNGKDWTHHIYFYVDKKIDKDISKYWLANKDQLKIVKEECLHWDWHIGYRSFFSSGDKVSADIIQFAFSATDIRAGITVQKYKKDTRNDVNIVTPTRNNIIGITNHVKEVDSVDWRKYCFTLPSWYFVARRNWKIFITWNCWVLGINTKLKIEDIKGKEKEIFDLIYSKLPLSHWNYHKEDQNVDFSTIEKTQIAEDIIVKFQAYKQVGTLWWGNHFIEIASGKNEEIWVIVHSGSRWIWHKIGTHYMDLAKQLNFSDYKLIQSIEKEFDDNPKYADIRKYNPEKYWEVRGNYVDTQIKRLSKWNTEWHYWLDINSQNWKDYIKDMNFCLEFALISRELMLQSTIKVLSEITNKDIILNYDLIEEWGDLINRNHNHAVLVDWLWVHRKWATDSSKGVYGIIPWNMRDWSFVVVWKWNPDSLCSSSHWAGRIYGRKEAERELTLENFQKQMKWIQAKVEQSTLDESPSAYKDIFKVMDLQKDSIEVINYLKPIINIKG